jgi:hypothetical protein
MDGHVPDEIIVRLVTFFKTVRQGSEVSALKERAGIFFDINEPRGWNVQVDRRALSTEGRVEAGRIIDCSVRFAITIATRRGNTVFVVTVVVVAVGVIIHDQHVVECILHLDPHFIETIRDREVRDAVVSFARRRVHTTTANQLHDRLTSKVRCDSGRV